MKRTVILAAFLLLAAQAPRVAERARAQGVDSCLELYQHAVWPWVPDSLVDNPDSVMVDTCGATVGGEIIGDPSSLEMFGKRYVLIFTYHVISLDSVSSDSVLIAPWSSIDTAYPTVRATFDTIIARFGGAYLVKEHPQIADSNMYTSNEFILFTGNYSPADTVLAILTGPLIRAGFMRPTVTSFVTPSGLSIEADVSAIYESGSRFRIAGTLSSTRYTLYDEIGRTVQEGILSRDGELDLNALPTGTSVLAIGTRLLKLFKGLN